MIVSLTDPLAVESVGCYDVSSGFKVSAVYVGNDVGSRNIQNVVVSLHLP